MLIAAVVVAAIVGALVVSAIIPSSSLQGEYGWLFKGAYATYEGSTSVSAEELGMLGMSFTMDFAVRQEIVDFNDTHALVSTSFEMNSSFGEFGGDPEENTESAWVPLSEMGLMTSFEDVDMINSYESTVNIDGLGTRACMVYEYKIAEEGLEMTVYVDKTIKWPLKMTMSMTNTEISDFALEFEMNLTETNIPALK
jgi:hypothetical protein